MKIRKYKFYTIFIVFGWLALSLNFVFAKIEIDTDKDGLSDYEEQIVYKTNKQQSDTDGDGFRDGEEVYNGFSPNKTSRNQLKQVILAVPYVPEAPDGNWTGPWKNACEESSIAMVEYYYTGNSTPSKIASKAFMWDLFSKQNSLYGSNADADSVRTNYLINNFSSFYGKVIDNPTLEQIKKELQQKRPVISLHYGFDLKNKNKIIRID